MGGNKPGKADNEDTIMNNPKCGLKLDIPECRNPHRLQFYISWRADKVIMRTRGNAGFDVVAHNTVKVLWIVVTVAFSFVKHKNIHSLTAETRMSSICRLHWQNPYVVEEAEHEAYNRNTETLVTNECEKHE